MGTTAAQLETEAAIWRSKARSLERQGKAVAAACAYAKAEALEWAAMVVRRSN